MLYSGKRVFELKATHGVPLDITFSRLLSDGIMIDWVEFIETARSNRWWDFQTYDVIRNGLYDAGLDVEFISNILIRVKRYIMENLL